MLFVRSFVRSVASIFCVLIFFRLLSLPRSRRLWNMQIEMCRPIHSSRVKLMREEPPPTIRSREKWEENAEKRWRKSINNLRHGAICDGISLPLVDAVHQCVSSSASSLCTREHPFIFVCRRDRGNRRPGCAAYNFSHFISAAVFALQSLSWFCKT